VYNLAMARTSYSKTVDFFYEVGSLRILQRSLNQHLHQNVASVAEHSQRVTIIAYVLAKKAKVNVKKVMLMAAFHDLPETRTGDSNWHQKEYMTQDKEKAWESQLELLGRDMDELKKVLKEYRNRKTLESKIAKDADNIEYVLSLKEMELQGNQEAKRRLRCDADIDQLHTNIGKKVMRSVLSSKPNSWYQKDRTKTRKKYKVK
jgi:putative hydrolase of HD superfamily